jgi:hypothetical protein
MRSRSISLAVLGLSLFATACASNDASSAPDEEVSSASSSCAKCDPATTYLKNGVCYAKPPAPTCPASIAPGTTCVIGNVRSLVDWNPLAKVVRVTAYDALDFATNAIGATPLVTVDSNAFGAFALAGVNVPASNLLTLVVLDTPGGTMFQPTGVMTSASSGESLPLDLYATPLTLLATWDRAASLPAFTFEQDGAYVARFVGANGHPVSGVTLLEGNADAASTFYFKTSMSTIDPTAHATEAATGAAVHRGDASLTSYSGQGGGVTWAVHPGASPRGAVVVQIF